MHILAKQSKSIDYNESHSIKCSAKYNCITMTRISKINCNFKEWIVQSPISFTCSQWCSPSCKNLFQKEVTGQLAFQRWKILVWITKDPELVSSNSTLIFIHKTNTDIINQNIHVLISRLLPTLKLVKWLPSFYNHIIYQWIIPKIFISSSIPNHANKIFP